MSSAAELLQHRTENDFSSGYKMKQQEILQKYKDHFFISYKNMGGSKKLVGNVAVVVFFVDDTKSDWTAAEKEDYKKTMKEAMRFLIKSTEITFTLTC